MPHKNNNDIKTDLRHDNMEFSASTDGDDKLDLDDDMLEEDDEISSDELDALENENDFEMAAALNAAENDRLTDADNLPEESDEDDYYDNEEVEEDDELIR
jgi:hypothetical protein